MNATKGRLLMISVMIARSTSFLFSKTLMHTMLPLNVLAVRFILAFLILCVIFHKKIIALDKETLKNGLILGLCYTLCMILEMYGLRLIDTGTSSFIENAAIVIVPLYQAVLLMKLPEKKTFLCSIIVFTGIGFLSLSGGSSQLFGIFLVILAALTYGACIMLTAKFSKKNDPITIGMIQLGTMGFSSLILSICTGTVALPATGTEWSMMMMLVLLCSCFGFTFQPVAQKYIKTETAAMFSAFNPLSTSIIGVIFASEGLGMYKLIGYALIFSGIIAYTKMNNEEEDNIDKIILEE